MEELSPLQKLDAVLGILRDTKNYKDLLKIVSERADLNLDGHNLNLLVEKLRDDRYIDFISNNTIVNKSMAQDFMEFRRNFEGDLFSRAGGYNQRETDRINDLQAIAGMNQRMERNAQNLVVWTRRLNFWTRIAAFAAIAIFLFDVLKWVIERMDMVFCH